MAKRKIYTRRRPFRRIRRRRDRRFPLIAGSATIGSFFVPRRAEQMSAGKWIVDWVTGSRPFKGEDVQHFAADLCGQYTGFDWRANQPTWSIPWATITIMSGLLASKLLNRLGVNKYRLPVIGNWVKF